MCKNSLSGLRKSFFVIVLSLFPILLLSSGTAFAQCGASSAPGSFDCTAFTNSYSPTNCVSEEYVNSISGTESGGRYVDCVNSIGATGRYQFMPFHYTAGGGGICDSSSLPCVTEGDFSHCPALQDAYFQEFNRQNYAQLESCGALDRVGQTINGVQVTESGLLAAAHLGGAGGACNWANSGGTYDPDDGATSLTDYVRTHGGLPAMGSDCPPVTPPTTPPPTASCSGSGSPMCTASGIGSSTDTGSDFLDELFPDADEFFRCTDRCDNHPDGTTREAYYYQCGNPPGSNYTQYTGCCCPGEIILGSIVPSRACPCCFGFLCDD